MIEELAKKVHSGDVFVGLAALHLSNNEWGRAKTAIDQALRKGGLSDQNRAISLLEDINGRLGISNNTQPAIAQLISRVEQ